MSTGENSRYEKEYLDFLIQKLRNLGGSIKFQHISGYFSQVKSEVRRAVGTSLSDLKVFIQKYPNVFKIEGDNVILINYNSYYDSEKIELPEKITNGKGVIINLKQGFGFLTAKDPVKTHVFFTADNFGDRNIDLTDYGLNIGTMVYFDAIKESSNKYTSKYKATKVWKIDKTDVNVEPVVPKSRKTRDTGLYDPLNISGEGIIQNVFSNLGFIAIDGDNKNTVFFYKNRVLNYDNIVDLTKIFQKGEKVEFKAHRSTKQDAKARWEATQVWKRSGKMYCSETISTTEEDKSQAQSSQLDSNEKNSSFSVTKNWSREIIENQRGKICPRTNGAVIKFGENYSKLADGDSSTYFMSGTEVSDVSWVFSEGDDVWFDAVKIKSAPGWKAIVVWTGEKPDIDLPVFLGNFHNDDEGFDEIPEASSYTSKSSYFSESSHASINSDNSSLNCHVENEIKSKLNLPILNEIPHKLSSNSSFDCETYYSISSSQNSLCSSTESKQLEKLKQYEVSNQSNPKGNSHNVTVSNWGDSFYPDEECQSLSSDLVIKDDCLNSTTDETGDNEMELFEEYLNNSEEAKQKCTEDNSSDFSSCTENVKNTNTDIVIKKASIKKFKNVVGSIIKVYSKFAEIGSSGLEKPLAFFWNTLYCNGKSSDDLHLHDLKEVIKVGDAINFNYFEITDDLGQIWQKITTAWTGKKPERFTEMTPDDFIKQNQLSVTLSHEPVKSKLAVQTSVKKFLTVVHDKCSDPVKEDILITDDAAEESMSVLSVTESCFGNEPSLKQEFTLNSEFGKRSEFDMLINVISQKLLNEQRFKMNEKVDVKKLSSDIVSLIFQYHHSSSQILQYHHADESSTSSSISLHEKEITSNFICSICGNEANHHNQNVGTKNNEVQTIITGDIIAQNIFTEC